MAILNHVFYTYSLVIVVSYVGAFLPSIIGNTTWLFTHLYEPRYLFPSAQFASFGAFNLSSSSVELLLFHFQTDCLGDVSVISCQQFTQ